jgi:CRISPR-associated endonuclease Csn1
VSHHIWAFDIGSKSIGWAVLGADGDGKPTGEVIAANVVLHDGGILNENEGTTRRAVRGEKVRGRRRLKRRKRRLVRLREELEAFGFTKQPGWRDRDPWWARHRLASGPVQDPLQVRHLVAIALGHMARHRGWRNPWLPAPRPAETDTPEEIINLARELDAPATLGGVCWALIRQSGPTAVRNRNEVPEGQRHLREYVPKVHQEHIAAEIAEIWRIQREAHPDLFTDESRDALAEVVLEQERPGVPLERIGKSEIGDPDQYRAPTASPLFQQFRLLDRIANLRIKEPDGAKRRLNQEERQAVYDLLDSPEQVEWRDVAARLGIDEERLMGNPDREGTAGRPPYNQVLAALHNAKIPARDRKRLLAFWENASPDEREALVALAIADRTIEVDDPRTAERVAGELEAQDLFEVVETVGRALPAGRARYSRQALGDLNDQMAQGFDRYEAIGRTYGHVPTGLTTKWDEPVPHAGVEVSMREVRRLVRALEREFGPPVAIGVEIVRDALRTHEERLQHNRRIAREREAREAARRCLIEDFGIANPTREQIAKREHMDAQGNQCLYCGATQAGGFKFETAELDHIVPRASGGSTTFVNIAAVCRRCNQAKGRRPFALWCAEDGEAGAKRMEETLERVSRMAPERWSSSPAKPYIDPNTGRWVRSDKDRNLDKIRRRLKKKSLDKEWGESTDDLQATAYAARVVRERLQNRYPSIPVRVFQGGLTAALRRETDLVEAVGLGGEKNRDDRRHHAFDAVAVGLLTHTTWAARIRRRDEAYHNAKLGLIPESLLERERERAPIDDLLQAVERVKASAPPIFNAMIPVCPRRVRTTGQIHEDRIRPWVKRAIGEAWSKKDIASVRDEHVRTALLRALPARGGLAADPERVLTLADGTTLAADVEVDTARDPEKGTPTATWIPVRGGWAKSAEIHHARLVEVTWSEDGREQSKHALVVVCLADVYGAREPFKVPLSPTSIAVRSCHVLARALAVDQDARVKTLLSLTQGDVFIKNGEAYEITTFNSAADRAESRRPARYGGEPRGVKNPDGPKMVVASAGEFTAGKVKMLRRDHLGRPTPAVSDGDRLAGS